MSRSCANRLRSFVDAVRQQVCRAKVKHWMKLAFASPASPNGAHRFDGSSHFLSRLH
jgi:hypothetical protein